MSIETTRGNTLPIPEWKRLYKELKTHENIITDIKIQIESLHRSCQHERLEKITPSKYTCVNCGRHLIATPT